MPELNLDLFVVDCNASLRQALETIEQNEQGVVFSIDSDGVVTGMATDGDIRRGLIAEATLDSAIGSLVNTKFIRAKTNTPRESLLKLLDHRIRIIPLLDDEGCLLDLISKDNIPLSFEQPVYARSRAPVRVSFGGGGSDLTHYFADSGGAVINSTVAIYSHATLRIRSDSKVIIHSKDITDTLIAEDIAQAVKINGKFALITALLKVVLPDYGFELYIQSDFPMKSGLGGSAVVSAAVLGCFNEFRKDKWDSHELAELAFQAERLHLGVAGGWQDQYASVFGGFNFMEFRMEQNIVHPLRVHPDIVLELEESLVLCDSSMDHESGVIHEHQKQEMSKAEVQEKVKQNVALTYQIRNHLLRGNLKAFGRDLNQAWHLKKQFSSQISSPALDEIYDVAMENGALGGKLLGAGGGGFFLFYVPPFRKFDLMYALEERGKKVQQFRFENDGLKSWTVRESN